MEKIFFNKFLCVPLIVWACVQVFKVISELITTKKFNFKRLMGAGGMPSSHSAVVTCLATLIGKEYGIDSGIFAMSCIFAVIVMYDAAGVRRAAGKQATLLNKLMETPNLSSVEFSEKLVEVLGHTPFQVFIGALIGILVGIICP
jgi:hypothetical protein